MAGLHSSTTNPLVQTSPQCLKCIHAKPVKKKKPIDIQILSDMVEDTKSFPTLANLRIININLMEFARFSISDEALHVSASDLEISQQIVISTYIARQTNLGRAMKLNTLQLPVTTSSQCCGRDDESITGC